MISDNYLHLLAALIFLTMSINVQDIYVTKRNIYPQKIIILASINIKSTFPNTSNSKVLGYTIWRPISILE